MIPALLVMFVLACSGQPPAGGGTTVIDHKSWTALLKKHVRADGMVDYKGIIRDSAALNAYLDQLSANAPDPDDWTREQQLAYWINAYNAFTVKLIVDNYPVASIKDLNPTVSIPMVNTIWNKKFFSIGGEEMSLDQIEHDILRKDFEEPRIHFAINCASISCPPLRAEAFVASRIDTQLEEQAISFINDPLRNNLDAENPQLSRIFNWFGGDFKKNGSLIDFINRYARKSINQDADIDFLDYDWGINDIE